MFAQFIAASGESRSAWADRLGISRSYLSDLLNGNKTPSLDLAVRIQRMTAGKVPVECWTDSQTDACADLTPSPGAAA